MKTKLLIFFVIAFSFFLGVLLGYHAQNGIHLDEDSLIADKTFLHDSSTNAPGESRRNLGKDIFRSFAMNPREFTCFLPEEHEQHLTSDEYISIVNVMNTSVGCLMPVLFLDSTHSEVYSVNQDSLGINHLYHFIKTSENLWLLESSSENLGNFNINSCS